MKTAKKSAMPVLINIVIATTIAFSVTACLQGASLGETPDVIIPSETIEPRALTAYGDCDALLAELKSAAIEEMEASLDARTECYDDVYDDNSDTSAGSSGTTSAAASADGTTASGTSDSGSSESTVSFTDTNVQETGVDEADTVKSDGTRLFVATGNGIDVFRIWPLSDFKKIATYDDGEASGLYLIGDELIVLSQSYGDEGASVVVTALDVSEAETPVTLWQKTVSGSLVDSRITNGTLHVAVASSLDYEITYPEFDYDAYETSCGDGSDAEAARLKLDEDTESAKQDLRAKIESSTFVDWLPGGDADLAVSCDNLLSDGGDDSNLAGLASLSLGGEAAQVTYIKGRAMEVYASSESVYLASNREDDGAWWGVETETAEDATDIHRFTLKPSDGLHAYSGSGAVKGHALDQFSMSEYEGTLRIATTVGHVSRSASSEVYSNVFILDAASPDLSVLGAVENIAPGEEIYAARFIGTRGYVVTFEKVDPLFVLDLADPENPVLAGELTMPGYSTYLHPMADGRLIGFGKDAEDAGTFSWYQGLKLGVYDVTDATTPSIVDELIIGSRGSDSAALYDHHAFNFDAATGILALPVSLYEGGSGGSDTGDFAYLGVHFYAVSSDEDITSLAEVPTSTTSYCDVPQRTVMIGDDEERGAYVIGTETVQLVGMNGDYEVAATQALGQDKFTGCEESYFMWD